MFEKKQKMPADKLSYICQAHVGEKAAKEFVAYYQIITKFKIHEIFKFIGQSLNENNLSDTIDKTIEKTKSTVSDELQFYALSHAAVIEFLQKTAKERKKLNYTDNLCVLLLSLEKNPKNPFPEMAISIIKELLIFMKDEPDTCSKIMSRYDEMAREVGMKTFSEMLDAITKSSID